MAPAQVEAWANYDQTAKAARHFSSNARLRQIRNSDVLIPHGRRHSDIVTLSRHSAKVRRVSGYVDRSYHGPQSRRPSLSTSSNEPGFFESITLEQGYGAKVLPTTDEKEFKLTEAALSDIEYLFSNLFECAFDSACDVQQEEPAVGSCLKVLKLVDATMPWVENYVQSKLLKFVDLCLRGIGQVYFQNNPMTGLLILTGILIQSTKVAVHGLIALVSGSLIAFVLGFDRGLARSGLFGYNSVLVGLALATFDSSDGYNAGTIVGSIVIGIFSSILFVMMGKLLVPYTSPPLTLPFNLATITFLLAVANMGRIDIDAVREQSLPDYEQDIATDITAKEFFQGTIRGVGQVFLADNVISGILVLAGIAVCSRIGAMAAVLGSALGTATAVATGVPSSAVAFGMFGFNASLSFTAMLMFYTPSVGALTLGTLSAILTVVAQQALDSLLKPWGLPFLTLPFCVVALPFIVIQGTTTLVIAVPLATMTVPEDHLRRVATLFDGFQVLKEAIDPDKTRLKGRSGSLSSGSQLKTAVNNLAAVVKSEIHLDKEDRATHGFCSSLLYRKQRKMMLEKEIVRQKAVALFDVLDEDKKESLHPDTILRAFRACELEDFEGLHFASLVLNIIDMDKSSTVEKPEFILFAIVSRAVQSFRRDVARFLDFVDVDGDGSIDFEELDSSLNYLGLPSLTEIEKAMLLAAAHAKEDDDGIDVVQFVNFLSVAKIAELVKEYYPQRK